ncbi:MAG: hypothetical protein ACO36G_04205 [Pelagibacteraceae bacterium]|jgi:hypothetical protein
MTHVMIQTWLLAAHSNGDCTFDNDEGVFDFNGIQVAITDDGFEYTHPEGTGLVISVASLKMLLTEYAY